MNQKKKILFLSVLLMTIGFASVSTVLYLNGETFVASNTGDFDVYFSKAVENGVENASIIKDKTHIEFTTELTGLDDTYVLDYDVTNASKQYDANIVMNCTGGNEYLRVENKFNTEKVLPARTTRSGVLTLTVIKAVMEETSVSISCEISGNAVERTEVGGEEITDEPYDCLKKAEYSSTVYLGHSLNRSKIESITLKDTKEVPSRVESWDVSNSGNGSILAYTLDEDNNDMLELYIGQNGGVTANPNSSYLFYEFTKIQSINGLEYFDTRNVMYMSYMFCYCSSLTSLDVSHLDTSNVTNMYNMFFNCSKLSSLDVSRFNTSKVNNMNCMFYGCSKLSSLDVSHLDTSNVNDMHSMFSKCSSLTSLDVSTFDTSKVRSMSEMFDGCSKLSSLDVSHLDTRNVSDMRGMFYNCSSLTSVDLSGFNTSNVKDMGVMFSNCSSLTSVDLSNFDTRNVTSMSYMFSSCSSLTSVDLSNFDTSKVKNMLGMFYNCTKLTTAITIRGTTCTTYAKTSSNSYGMFEGAATENGAQITVNYTEEASDLVDKMIATKSSTSNVVKGSVVA